MKPLLLCALSLGCEPSYWVQDYDLRSARHRSQVRAARNADGDDPLQLKASSLDGVHPDETDGTMVRVTPRHPRLTAGWIVFGVGAALGAAAIGAGLGGSASCHEGECWVTPLVSGSVLGAVGGLTMIIGGSIAGTSLHEAEVR